MGSMVFLWGDGLVVKSFFWQEHWKDLGTPLV